MKIAVEGCAHGELEIIYDTIEEYENRTGEKIDVLLCCGDFQSTRNLSDLRCMAVPPKYYDICTFYKYYTGEKVAPCLTIFIGGNHEASNYLQELPYGGWVAPKIYYLGYAGVVNFAGLRIAGISGIFKNHDYCKGRYEYAPYSEEAKRSVYHIRNLDIFRLKQLSDNIDIFLSHDWPSNVCNYGNLNSLLKKKPSFKYDIENGKLGSKPCESLLNELKPTYWFSAHLHCKFAAIIPHKNDDEPEKSTKFLALDKCLPKRKFLQVLDVPHDTEKQFELSYDLEWLTILYLTNHLLSVKQGTTYMPGPNSQGRWKFTPTEVEKNLVLEKFENDLKIPENFCKSASAFDPNEEVERNMQQPKAQLNPQTTLLCEKLSIHDPVQLLLMLNGCDASKNSNNFNESLDVEDEREEPTQDDIKTKLNSSAPTTTTDEFPSPKTRLNMSLPAPKHNLEDFGEESEKFSFDSTKSNSNSELNFDLSISSTPQTKKFKRRNESIYSNNDE